MAKARHGNGAREALMKILDNDAALTDHVLAVLWVEGFVVKPLGEAELNPRKCNVHAAEEHQD